MEIRKLRHAVTLARFLNFTRAAHDLAITQSALSRSIQALESECGLLLFDRNRGMVALTQAGRQFIRHAEALLRSEAALRHIVGHASLGTGGHVALGVTPLAARVLVAPVLSTRLEEPNFHAEVMMASGKQIVAMIVQQTIDLGICMADPAFVNAGVTAVHLAHLPLAAIVRQGHPLTRLAEFRASDMEGYPLIRSSGPDDVMPFDLGLVGAGPPAVTVDEYDVLDQIVATSDAIWITSPIAAQQSIASGELAALPMSWLPDLRISLAAYTRSRGTLPPLAASLLDQFRSFCATFPA